jgi:hypothetical protein
LLLLAGVITGIVGHRSGRHMEGPSSRRGAMIGVTWSVAFAGMTAVLSQLSGHLPDDLLGMMWAAVMVALTSALHMAGAAVWNDRPLFVLGAWTSVVNVIGVIAGPGWHSLIVALAAGGGMLLVGLIGWLRLR